MSLGEGSSGAADAAADAPAGGAGAAVPAPSGPTRSATESAADAARQRLAATGTILPAGEGGEGGAAETDEERAARDADEAHGGAGETEEQKAARVAAEAAAGHEGETAEQKAVRETAEAAAADEDHPEWTVKLEPIADKGEEPLEIQAPDEETYNRLNRLQNEAVIGRQVRQERRVLERQTELLESVEDQITVNPAGFVLERVDEGVRADVAMQLLFDAGILEAIQERLQKSGVEGGLAGVLDDPNTLRVIRAELERDQLKMEKQLRADADGRKAARVNATRVAAQIEKMIPDNVVGEQRERLYSEAVKEVSERCKRLGIARLEDEDVALLVGTRFRQEGIRPAAPAAGKDGGKSGRAGALEVTGPTADKLKAAQDAKRRAAAAAPAGAGAPAAKARPDLPATTEGRIAAARKFGLRRLLGKT